VGKLVGGGYQDAKKMKRVAVSKLKYTAMASRTDEWRSLWRSAAYSSVPYTEDFPECLLVLPELIDGGVAQGHASKIRIRMSLNNDGTRKSTLCIEDNGVGIANEVRLLRWASSTNGEGDTAIHHRYGQGSKICLAKFCRDYEKAVWMIQYRKKDRRGVSGSLHVITGPFRGRDDTTQMEDENDDTNLMPSGTRWTLDFDADILGIYQDPEKLYAALKEILRTRYSADYFTRIEFVVEVYENNMERFVGNSRSEGWTTFQEVLEEAVSAGIGTLLYDVSQPFNTGTMTFRYYRIAVDGRSPNPLKEQFPKLGQKNMPCSRIHIALDGRFIEARHIYKFLRREANHNDFNGLYGIVNFKGSPEELPVPATVKVQFYDNCQNYIQFAALMAELLTKPVLKPPAPTAHAQTTPVLPSPTQTAPVLPFPTQSAPAPSVPTPPTNSIINSSTNATTEQTITFKIVKRAIHVAQGSTVLYRINLYKINCTEDADECIDVLKEILRVFGLANLKKFCESLK